MKKQTPYQCSQCRSGVDVAVGVTFSPSCVGCQRLLAAGKRTGKEPRPQRLRYTFDAERLAREKAARAKFYASLPSVRRC